MLGEVYNSRSHNIKIALPIMAMRSFACILSNQYFAQFDGNPPISSPLSNKPEIKSEEAGLITSRAPCDERISVSIHNLLPAQSKYATIYLVGLPHGAILSDNHQSMTVMNDVDILEITTLNLKDLTLILPGDLVSRAPETKIYVGIAGLLPASETDSSARVEKLLSMVIIPQASLPPSPEPRVVQVRTAAATPSPIVPQAAGAAGISGRSAQAEPQPATPTGQGSAVEPLPKALVAKAQQALRLGNVSGARLFLRRAASAGDADAINLLGQTYDEAFLHRLGSRGLKADPKQARMHAEAAAQARQGSVRLQARTGSTGVANGGMT
ncbi:hypothetical protein [Methylobacterium sp. WSM2598]|uniref:hypothetical protein n=1 Tax=Methylobacterium sp. WSM2598 TaxID=398261 RepID=UPI0012F6B0F1|nr:hypothetical protein [Methylobacterium sp. WSM2598]